MLRICKFHDCERPAYRGHTMCARHHSAGLNLTQEKMRGKVAAKPDAKLVILNHETGDETGTQVFKGTLTQDEIDNIELNGDTVLGVRILGTLYPKRIIQRP